MFKFRSDLFDEANELGSGNFGKVCPYKEASDGLKWVVKQVLAPNIEKLNTSLQEVVLGFSCNHPCIVPVKGYFIKEINIPDSSSKYFHIYMKIPRMEKTLLTDLKEKRAKKCLYTEKEIVQHFYSLVCGIEYLHSKRIYHGDIKPDNLLLDAQGNLKVTDVGVAKHFEEEESGQIISKELGACQYLSPEILGPNATKEKLPKADIWSIGVVILELCLLDTRKVNPVAARDEIERQVRGCLENLREKYQGSLLNLIRRLLSLDPQERPEIEKLKEELEQTFPEILEDYSKIIEEASLTVKRQKYEQKISVLNEERKQFTEIISELETRISMQEQIHKDSTKLQEEQKNIIIVDLKESFKNLLRREFLMNFYR